MTNFKSSPQEKNSQDFPNPSTRDTLAMGASFDTGWADVMGMSTIRGIVSSDVDTTITVFQSVNNEESEDWTEIVAEASGGKETRFAAAVYGKQARVEVEAKQAGMTSLAFGAHAAPVAPFEDITVAE